MSAFSTRGHFCSCDEDGGHTIQSAIDENPTLQANFKALNYRNTVIADQSFTLREYGFSTIFAPVTLTLTRLPSYTNLTHIPSRCIGGAKMNFLCQSFRKLSSDRHTYIRTYRQTHWTKIIYHTTLRVVNIHQSFKVKNKVALFYGSQCI